MRCADILCMLFKLIFEHYQESGLGWQQEHMTGAEPSSGSGRVCTTLPALDPNPRFSPSYKLMIQQLREKKLVVFFTHNILLRQKTLQE